MSKTIPIFPAGPGTQPQEADGAELTTLGLPTEMGTFTAPVIPEPEQTVGLVEARQVLGQLLEALRDYQINDPARVLDLSHLDQANRTLVDQVLGEGEVSVLYRGDTGARIQESVLAGVWRVQYEKNGELVRDTVEVAAIPALVNEATFRHANATVNTNGEPPAGLQNALPLMAELNDKIAAWQPGAPPHVINLTLLPHSEQDLTFLAQGLGEGPVTVLSRGYGNCRVTSTATRNVWWVQYFNSQDANILNTLEVTDVPSVACAAQEDMEDSAERLQEILEAHL